MPAALDPAALPSCKRQAGPNKQEAELILIVFR